MWEEGRRSRPRLLCHIGWQAPRYQQRQAAQSLRLVRGHRLFREIQGLQAQDNKAEETGGLRGCKPMEGSKATQSDEWLQGRRHGARIPERKKVRHRPTGSDRHRESIDNPQPIPVACLVAIHMVSSLASCDSSIRDNRKGCKPTRKSRGPKQVKPEE